MWGALVSGQSSTPLSLKSRGSWMAHQMSLSSHRVTSLISNFSLSRSRSILFHSKRVTPNSRELWLRRRPTRINIFDVTEIQTFYLVPTIVKISIHFIVFCELLQNIGVCSVHWGPTSSSIPLLLLSAFLLSSIPLPFSHFLTGILRREGHGCNCDFYNFCSQRFSVLVQQLRHLELHKHTFLQAALRTCPTASCKSRGSDEWISP